MKETSFYGTRFEIPLRYTAPFCAGLLKPKAAEDPPDYPWPQLQFHLMGVYNTSYIFNTQDRVDHRVERKLFELGQIAAFYVAEEDWKYLDVRIFTGCDKGDPRGETFVVGYKVRR